MSRLRTPLLFLLVVLVVLVVVGAGCAPAELSTDELIQHLQKAGIEVEDVKQERSQMQKEFDNLNDALSTGMPMPKLKRAVKLNGVLTDIFWCPGKRKQADLIVRYALAGEMPGDPANLDIAASVVDKGLNIPFESHIISMAPTKAQDADALKIALALARIEDR